MCSSNQSTGSPAQMQPLPESETCLNFTKAKSLLLKEVVKPVDLKKQDFLYQLSNSNTSRSGGLRLLFVLGLKSKAKNLRLSADQRMVSTQYCFLSAPQEVEE